MIVAKEKKLERKNFFIEYSGCPYECYNSYNWSLKVRVDEKDLQIIRGAVNNLKYYKSKDTIFLLFKDEKQLAELLSILDTWIDHLPELYEKRLFAAYNKLIEILI